MNTKHITHYSQKIRWLLVFYDILTALICCLIFYVLYPILTAKNNNFNLNGWLQVLYHFLLTISVFIFFRMLFKVYSQIWRYGGISSYIRLLISDFLSLIVYIFLEYLFSNIPGFKHFMVVETVSCCSMTLLLCMSFRMLYRFAYRYLTKDTKFGHFLKTAIRILARVDLDIIKVENHQKIRIAIVGAGRTGVGLAEELIANQNSNYVPKLFIENSKEKCGRNIYDIPVLFEKDLTDLDLKDLSIQEIVFALPNLSSAEKNSLYNLYKKFGCKLKIYDYPLLSNSSSKKTLREFDIEELLFRKPIDLNDDSTNAYYKGKVILITGGGGSIGSELAKQIASMEPKRLILLDIYENGVYDVEQELKIKYKGSLDLSIEICSITNLAALEEVFKKNQIDIVIHAAAHKHVPLMEHNVVEAIENNIFGTDNVINLTEKYKVGRFLLVSTDKAVNPTNVMGATKRFCEMNVFAHANVSSNTVFSATRFGNVLGSAGSVIPLFKKQISAGGPITITHKDIIRYFMTIPEASKLVLTSGAMAKNGELFVLDMGEPVKIYDLAEAMISLSGYIPGKDIQIVETGLRPGEKLYEELLINSQTLTKTDNDLIFIEKDDPISLDNLNAKLHLLERLVNLRDEEKMKQNLSTIVPTYIEKNN